MLKCTILDDYQKVAFSIGRWLLLERQVKVRWLQYHVSNEDDLVNALIDQGILVIMRERSLFNAPVLSRLPNLKLLVNSGMGNAAIDLNYAMYWPQRILVMWLKKIIKYILSRQLKILSLILNNNPLRELTPKGEQSIGSNAWNKLYTIFWVFWGITIGVCSLRYELTIFKKIRRWINCSSVRIVPGSWFKIDSKWKKLL